MFKGTLILALFALSMQAKAYYNLLPKGTRQSLLGNNGIALTESDGAGAYNPASIVGIKGPTISASGSVASITSFSFGNSVFQDKSDSPTLDINSTYLSILFTTENFNYGFYISNELNFSFIKYLEFNSPSATGSANTEIFIKYNKIGFLIGSDSENFFMVQVPPYIL